MSALVHTSPSVTFHFDRKSIRYGSSSYAATDLCASELPTAEMLTYKVAETKLERERAFRLVYDVYRNAGLMSASPSKMRVTKHHLLETTDVLVARHQTDVLFTISSIRDGAFGLPLESIFGNEVEDMRNEGLNLAEVSCVASHVPTSSKKLRFEILVKMMSIMAQQAQRNRVDRLLLAVHPRHAKVYQRLFGCKILSGEKSYAAVEDNPAVLCSHDFASLEIERYPLYDAIQGPVYDPWQLASTRMSDDELEYFSTAVATGETEQWAPLAA